MTLLQLNLLVGFLWLVGAIVYGAYVNRKDGPEDAVGDAVIWPIALVIRISEKLDEKK